MAPKAVKKVVNAARSKSTSPFTSRPKPAEIAKPYPTGGGSKSYKSGLVFNVDRTWRQLKRGRYAEKVKLGAAIYMTGVIEYLMAELLELSGNCAASFKRSTIKPRFIMLAIKNDDELAELLSNVTMPAAGVVPHVHSVLLPKRTTKRRRTNSNNQDESQAF